MAETVTITTTAVLYNDDHKFMVIKRSEKEEHAPGVYAYPGGGFEYNFKDEDFDVLEKNLSRELKEELDITVTDFTYISTHTFTKKTGEKVVLAAFMAKYNGTEFKPQSDEIAEVTWKTAEEIQSSKNMFDTVKKVFAQAAEKLNNTLYHVMLGGLVINDNQEFLLIRGIENGNPGKLTYPQVPMLFTQGAGWEAMEDSLAKGIFAQTGIEVADGCIPFTDQAFVAPDQFEGITQFFICKYKFEKEQIANTSKVSEIIWQKFADFDRAAFLPADYLAFEKAQTFISNLL